MTRKECEEKILEKLEEIRDIKKSVLWRWYKWLFKSLYF